MTARSPKILDRVLPFVGIAIMAFLVIIGLIVFSYIIIIAAIIGLVVFIIAWIRAKWWKLKQKQPPSKSKGRVIDHEK